MVEDATMERRSWLWRRKSSEKSPGETDSSGSVSSHSERYYDDHEVSRASPNNASPNHIESPEVSLKVEDTQVHETVKSLTEKLSAAVLNINAKDELVKQHAKVAEEAIAGWEKAETEVLVLKKQLEAACQKNSALEDRIGHLDRALKECVRELRQSREEQEQKIHDAIIKRTRDWESEKFELENQLGHVHAQLEGAKADAASSLSHDLQLKLEAYEKENSALKVELLVQSKDLQKRTIERDLSIQAAEAASKQHLESIKKVTKLESECRRLLSIGRKTLVVNDNKGANSVCVESVTDSHSDSGERLLGLDNEAGCSDAWATALIAELDQFKNDKGSTRNLASSVDIELMDDFLEMERLVAMPDAESGSSGIQVETDTREIPLKVTELELKDENLETEKIELELALADTRKQLEVSLNQLTMAESKLAELQRQLDLAEKTKQLVKLELVDTNEKWQVLVSQLELSQSEVRKLSEKVSVLEAESIAKLESARKISESQLQSAYSEASKLSNMVSILECKVEKEKALVAEYAANVSKLEAERNSLESQLNLAQIEVRELHDKVRLLESQVEEQRVLCVALANEGEATETRKKALESQLEISNLEIRNLHDKVGLLEGELDKERAFSSAFATKCQNLEEELLKRKRETELWYMTRSNGELKINKEKELAAAAEKLAECQKTIASLTKHLQLLTLFEVETPELNATSADLISEDVKQLQCSGASAFADCSTAPNGNAAGAAPSPVSPS